MELNEWRQELKHEDKWMLRYGDEQSPVVIAALDPATRSAADAIRRVLAAEGVRLFLVGPAGTGKSLFVSALIADAQSQGQRVTIVSPATTAEFLGDLAKGAISLLAVHAMGALSSSAQKAIVANRARCSIGMVVAAEGLSATTAAALTEPLDLVVELPPIESRPRDVLALCNLMWPEICGVDSDLLTNVDDEAAVALCRGPYEWGAESLRRVLEQLADALITMGDLVDGEFRRTVETSDVTEAVLAVIRSERPSHWTPTSAAAIVVEGTTDATYLAAAAAVAEHAWQWNLLEGCEIVPAGEDRAGGAEKVWKRLLGLSEVSSDCVGLFDNDDVGRREFAFARKHSLGVELIPPEFDRLGLADHDRCVEIEDLLCVRVLDRFYGAREDLQPEERRERLGRRRVVPKGVDKEALASWARTEMTIEDCERLVYLLCRLRKALGLPIPRDDLDSWLRNLMEADC